MEPGVIRSIQQGFVTTHRAWAGLALVVGVSFLLWLLMFGMVVLTNVPEELLRPPASQPAPGAVNEPAASPPATSVEQAGDAAAVADEQPTDAGLAAQEALSQQLERQGQLALEWLGRAWPILLIAAVVFIGLSLWLQAGQIGYLGALAAAGTARLSVFWSTATQAFGRILASWLLSLLAAAAGIALVALGAGVWQLLAAVAPGWLTGLGGFLSLLALIVGLMWIAVRLAFWYIIVVIDRAGPIKGLVRSFRLARGRWWRVFGIGLLITLMLFAAQLILGVVDGIGNLIGGPLPSVLGMITGLLGAVASAYFGFVGIASYLHFYQVLRASEASSEPAGA